MKLKKKGFNQINLLPPYTVRESYRAKHVSLKISAAGVLEVVVPLGFDQERVPEIIQRKQNWIERVTRQAESQQARANLQESKNLPLQIALPAISETWNVEYRSAIAVGMERLTASNFKLTLYGSGDQEQYQIALQQWMLQKAQLHLIPWLQAISQELELPFKRAAVRRQKTKWGSCSSQKTISLNCKLLFLPEQLVRYVCIHELCHTVHLDHSSKFWALVERYEPRYKQLDTGLKDARYWVPQWMN